MGIDCSCIGVGVVYPASVTAVIKLLLNPRLSKLKIFDQTADYLQ
jgi:hypothetical protein